MFPHLHGISTMNLLLFLAFLLSIGILLLPAPSWKRLTHSVLLVATTAFGAVVGGRLLHVFWERPELLNTPALIFSRWDGMVFYGAMAGGLLLFLPVSRILFPRQARGQINDLASIALAISSSLLRIGCFGSGCCWGKLSFAPWAVRFPVDPPSLMPSPGIPVHPVQLYDSFLGFFVSGVLICLFRREKMRGRLFALFCFLHPIARFTTEHFRGDSFRGDDVFLALSTSQIISIALLGFSTWILLKPISKSLMKIAGSIALLQLSGCVLPTPPSSTILLKSEQMSSGVERHFSRQDRVTLGSPSFRRGNALFLTADTVLYSSLKTRTQEELKTSELPSLDDFAWWEQAPKLTELYTKILRIPTSAATHQNVIDALLYLESLGEPYDVYLLSHGIPNHLSSGEGYFLSFRELSKLRGKLPLLNLVFMQACFGQSLAEDWHEAGAKSVVSFPGLNRNFFWISFFVRYYRYYDLQEAARKTSLNMDFHLEKDPLYSQVLKFLGVGVSEYLENFPNPTLSSARTPHLGPGFEETVEGR